MSSVAQRLRRHLDEHGVAYSLLEHEPAGTAEEYHALLGTRYEQQAKSVFVRHKGGAGGGFAILAIQAQKRADLKRVATLLGARRARMGTIEERSHQVILLSLLASSSTARAVRSQHSAIHSLSSIP